MKTEWRPEGWEETCDCKDLPPEQQCSMYKNFEAGASAMLAARDKEWVAGVDAMMREMGMTTTQDANIYDYAIQRKWQQLKKKLEKKND